MNMLFHFLAIVAAILAMFTVISKNVLRSAVYLMGVLSVSAGLYLMAGAEFLAGIQILVYVGGIVVLIVFAVMLTQSADLIEDRPSALRKVLGFLSASAFFGGSVALLSGSPLLSATPPPALGGGSQIHDIGRKLLDTGPAGYVLPFEVISLLLLAVLIGGIVIARGGKPAAVPAVADVIAPEAGGQS